MRFDFDRGDFPLVAIRARRRVPQRPSRPALDFYRDARALLDEGRTFAVLLDLREASLIDAAARRRFADFLDAERERIACQVAAVAVVADSPLHVGVARAVTWLTASPAPFEIFLGDVERAAAWARAELGAAEAGAGADEVDHVPSAMDGPRSSWVRELGPRDAPSKGRTRS